MCLLVCIHYAQLTPCTTPNKYGNGYVSGYVYDDIQEVCSSCSILFKSYIMYELMYAFSNGIAS